MSSKSATSTSRRLFICALAAGALGAISACTPQIDHRGYLPRAGDLQKITPGMSKTEVEAILGSPSTTATITRTGDSYYYISSKIETQGFMDPKETERKIFAVRFDQIDQVQSFAQYSLEDRQVINVSSRKTPTRGRELTILQQMFGNLGGNIAGALPGGK